MIPPLRCRPPCLGPHNLAHGVPRYLKLSSDRLDSATLNEVRTSHPATSVHRDHPPTDPCATHAQAAIFASRGRGQNCAPITPDSGSKLHAGAQPGVPSLKG